MRDKFSDNLNLQHLAKIESIARMAVTAGVAGGVVNGI
jgi:hypothetical protein